MLPKDLPTAIQYVIQENNISYFQNCSKPPTRNFKPQIQNFKPFNEMPHQRPAFTNANPFSNNRPPQNVFQNRLSFQNQSPFA